jgi:hypothetical protein
MKNKLLDGSGRAVRKPCERLSGHGIQKGDCPSQERGQSPFCMSEALNRAAFGSLGQKRRADEPLCRSHSNGFLNTQPEPVYTILIYMRFPF